MCPPSETTRATPPGILLLTSITRKDNYDWHLTTYRYIVLIVTFLAYTCYHASRKPTGIVKSLLHPHLNPNLKGWPPFDAHDGTSKLGEIDLAFLASYSIGMYVAGHLGDTLDLRLFLTAGMIGSGLFVGLFGMGYFWDIHAFSFFLLMQMIAGLFQATGWPSVVAVVGNWFGKRKRGLIMGVWNAHTSVGNIVGTLVAASVLEFGWGWSFIAPAALMVFGGFVVYFLLPAYPEDVGFPNPTTTTLRFDQEAETEGNLVCVQGSVSRKSVGVIEACEIPGVITFALCLFFAKLVAYTFLYWLPFYLSRTEIGGEYVSVKSAGNLSALFDVGGIFGGILAGYISDRLRARAITAATFMYAAIPSMLLYRSYGSISMGLNILLMMLTGLFVNGPYALITTAVSADLGTHSCLRGNSRALATVTAIIDGTGSVGAALGPLLTGFISRKGWDGVFIMLMVGAFVAGLLLSRLVIAEIAEKTGKPIPFSSARLNPQAMALTRAMLVIAISMALLSFSIAQAPSPAPTHSSPSPTPTPTPTAAPSPSPSPTISASPSPSPTASPPSSPPPSAGSPGPSASPPPSPPSLPPQSSPPPAPTPQSPSTASPPSPASQPSPPSDGVPPPPNNTASVHGSSLALVALCGGAALLLA
ncbi:putative glycerol-3-phosphate transporter 4 [Senna tora]|uniref:Putative glycerol-3-phosphate transporter 4 n=1 Tax=Senna tora TaxID=362788 RepID=A0A834WMJ1_9FABA|nr:putative glycerol-3-phosphate transporter 4 [Senna tora]